MIQRNVRFMISMVKMHSKKEWVAEVACMTHLTSFLPSLVEVHLEVSSSDY